MIDLPIFLLALSITLATILVPGFLIYRRTRDMFVVWLASPFTTVLGMPAAHHFVSLAVLR